MGDLDYWFQDRFCCLSVNSGSFRSTGSVIRIVSVKNALPTTSVYYIGKYTWPSSLPQASSPTSSTTPLRLSKIPISIPILNNILHNRLVQHIPLPILQIRPLTKHRRVILQPPLRSLIIQLRVRPNISTRELPPCPSFRVVFYFAVFGESLLEGGAGEDVEGAVCQGAAFLEFVGCAETGSAENSAAEWMESLVEMAFGGNGLCGALLTLDILFHLSP